MRIQALFLIILLAKSFAANSQERISDKKSYNVFFQNNECNSTAFEYAMRGYHILKNDGLLGNERYLTIIDFTKPSNAQRLFLLDMKLNKLVLKSLTAHGVGSDPDSLTIPYRFGDKDGSKMSSVGFYITGETYINHRPNDSIGLCLFGLDKGFNDSAAVREIVVHYGATERSGNVYVTDSGAARSYGCPTLPLSTNTRVINLIKGGSCVFIYSDKVTAFRKKSTVLNNRIAGHIVQQGPPPNNCQCHLSRKRK